MTATKDLTERMKRGCLLDIPNTPCTRCGWDPDEHGGMYPSLGGMAVRWIRENLIFGEGDFFGMPFNPLPDQELFLYRWYEFCPDCDQWRFKEALRMEATGGGKAVALDTPLPTPSGWTTMGEVRVGDQVLGADGKPTQVVHKSPVYTDHRCYRLRFEGGEEIVADADHQWQLDHWNGSKWVTKTVTTAEVAEIGLSRSGRRVWRVREGDALELPDEDLPLDDPWLLGYWLGNGDTDQPHLTIDDADLKSVVASLEDKGWDLTWLTRHPERAQKIRIKGLLPLLRETGVLSGKHVPESYLRGSEGQRLSLLQGLMDSNGSCHQGRCEFVNKNVLLADAVFELASSLGVRCDRRTKRVGGTDYHLVSWTAPGEFFTLARKQAEAPVVSRTDGRRMLVGLQPAETVPVQCIAVDNADHLYRVGRSMVVTHNTQFVAAIVLLEFAGPPEIAPSSPNVAVAAASWEQADLCFGQAALMVGGSDDDVIEAPLCGAFDVYDSKIRFKGSRPGVIKRTASIAGTNEGGLPHLFVCDELHEWGEEGSKKARVHFVIGKSTNKRRIMWDPADPTKGRGSGRILNISTAGFDKENSILGTMYARCFTILQDQTIDPRFLVNIYQARAGLNYDLREDRKTACQDASPAANIIWDVNDRVNEWGKVPNHEWIRYYGNVWPEISEDSWLVDHPQAWDHCYGTWESDRKNNVWVITVDMALKQDSVAVNQVEWIPDDAKKPEAGGRFAVTAKIWKASDYEGRIPHNEVWHYIRDIAPKPKDRKAKGGFRGVVYDPRFFEVPAMLLEEDGYDVIEFNQSADQMAPACGLAYKMILEKRIVHDGDGQLAQHVRKATAVPMERGGFVLKKGRSMGKIDACIAMIMGVSILHHLPKRRVPLVAVVGR